MQFLNRQDAQLLIYGSVKIIYLVYNKTHKEGSVFGLVKLPLQRSHESAGPRRRDSDS
jgi:hypothetical protein